MVAGLFIFYLGVFDAQNSLSCLKLHRPFRQIRVVRLIQIILHFPGKWSIGLATRKADLNTTGGSDQESWVLTSHGTLRHNGTIIHSSLEVPSEGSIVVWLIELFLIVRCLIFRKPYSRPCLGMFQWIKNIGAWCSCYEVANFSICSFYFSCQGYFYFLPFYQCLRKWFCTY